MSDRTVTRVRHELRLRLVEVVEVVRAGPRLIRATVGGEQLHGFSSPGFDDHVKLFIPPGGAVSSTLPVLGPDGPVFEAGAEPALRDYTPHSHDAGALTLQFDFALHDAGPATAWALKARKGSTLVMGGPRGSSLVGTGFDWHLLMGDDTALPAIRRRLAELLAGSRAVVFAEVDGPGDEERMESRAAVTVHWLHRTRRGRKPGSCLLLMSDPATGRLKLGIAFWSYDRARTG